MERRGWQQVTQERHNNIYTLESLTNNHKQTKSINIHNHKSLDSVPWHAESLVAATTTNTTEKQTQKQLFFMKTHLNLEW